MHKKFCKDLLTVDIPKYKFIFAIRGKIRIDFCGYIGIRETNFQQFESFLEKLSKIDIQVLLVVRDLPDTDLTNLAFALRHMPQQIKDKLKLEEVHVDPHW